MTQEEKIKEAKRLYESANADQRYVLERLFPELKESDGERIRKSLRKCFEWLRDDARWTDVYGSSFDSIFSWLEKKGEQKPIPHKFRIGDKVKKGYLTYTVEDIDEDSYKLQAYQKDGDKGCTVFLTIGYEKDYELVGQKPIFDVEIPFGAKDSELKEASYNIPNGYHAEVEDNKVVIKKGEQKPAWSEEDEKMLKWLCRIVHSQRVEKVITLKEESELGKWMDKWLNHNPQPHWKPSDEQMDALKESVDEHFDIDGGALWHLYEDLKKLREE